MTNNTYEHAVHRLHRYRQSIATRPYLARGMKVQRCPKCLLPQVVCSCAWRRSCVSQAAFVLLMYDTEVLKPSNSGRLIADLIPDTHAFLWSRTAPDAALLALLADPQYQPLLVFPAEYALPGQQLLEVTPETPPLAEAWLGGKRPLFILLDGCWREAVKMFRKSPYLHGSPLLSFHPETLAAYQLRKGQRDFQLGTAEVAALALAAFGEQRNAAALTLWFGIFVASSLWSRSAHDPTCLQQREQLAQQFLALLE